MALVERKGTHSREHRRQKQRRSLDELAAALESADTGARRAAAREMGQCRDAAKVLVSRLRREPYASVREVILSSVIRLNDPASISGLVDCLRSEDAALRNGVIEAFRQLGNDVAPVLRSLLVDPDPDVRIFVVNILDLKQRPEVETWLIGVIERDAHVNVCGAAVDLLCEVGTEAAIDPLLRLKSRFPSEPYIQFAAGLALRRIGEG